MYGYVPEIEIEPEQILQKIDAKLIFELVFKTELDLSQLYCSPFREDKKPNCRFEYREDGTLLFIDFGERTRSGHTHRNFLMAVADAYDTTSTRAIGIICSEFGLSTFKHDYQPITVINPDNGERSIADLSYDKKEITRLDIGFWSQFLIRPEHTVEDNVFPVRRFRIKKGAKFTVVTPYKYCYCMDFIAHKKFYQPFNPDYKWITNCNENDIGNIDNLPLNGEELIIQKAYKDHRVVRNVIENSNVIWMPSEGVLPDPFILKNLSDRFRLITIFYDNDEAGILAALILKAAFENIRQNSTRVVCMPYRTRRKDIGEFVQREGRKDTFTLLNEILWVPNN